MCLAQGHNAVTPVGLEPMALRSRVKLSTTEPLRSLVGHSLFIVAPIVCGDTVFDPRFVIECVMSFLAHRIRISEILPWDRNLI